MYPNASARESPARSRCISGLFGSHMPPRDYGAVAELGNELLEALSVQPETAERVRDEIALEMSLARSMIAVYGYTAEVERSIRAAIERSSVGGTPHEFSALRSLATLHMMRGEFERGLEVGDRLLTIAKRQQDPQLLSDAHLVIGVPMSMIDPEEGMRHLDLAIAHFSPEASGLAQFRVGPSAGVAANIASGLQLWMVGSPDRALARVDAGLKLATALGHPYSLAYALFHAALLNLWRQELALVAERSEELLRVANEHDYPIWRALALVLRGSAMVSSGQPEAGLAEVDRGFALYAGLTTPPVFWPALLLVRASAYSLAGRFDEAIAIVDEAEDALQESDPQHADMDCARGEILLGQSTPDSAAAETCFERAVARAGDRGNRMTQLVAATRLATLRRGTPREVDARDALRRIVDSFTEGATTPQLAAARMTLDGE